MATSKPSSGSSDLNPLKGLSACGGDDEYTGAAIKIEELFFYWLCQKETVDMVDSCITKIVQGGSLAGDPPSEVSPAAGGCRLLPSFQSPLYSPLSTQLPRSPTSSPRPQSFFKQTRSDARQMLEQATTTLIQEDQQVPASQSFLSPKAASVPIIPKLRTSRAWQPSSSEVFSLRQAEVAQYFREHETPSGGISVQHLKGAAKAFCGIPAFLGQLLAKRINDLYGSLNSTTQYPVPAPSESAGLLPTNSQPELRVTYDQFCTYYRDEVEPYHEHERIFRLLKQPDYAYLVKEDLQPCLQQLLMLHPGLEFLNAHPDFQHKYALTVITRVFYNVNRSGTGKITWKEVRNSKFCQGMRFVDENEDINKETRFFSYEHFYVLYCRFWELDTDRDGLLGREDLLKYGDHALSSAIVDRVFEVGPRPFRDGRGGGRSPDNMAYDDFIYFMLSEEDKGNEASLRYWFHCVDVDGDGVISFQEMRFFYNIQLQRMEWLGHELVPFEDVLCQMLDMLKPKNLINGLRIEDFLCLDKIKISGVFFDALFNLNKFIQFEQRDPFGDRQKREDPFENDWDRFAYRDYQQLAQDEEDNEGYSEEDVTSMEVDEQNIMPNWGTTTESNFQDDMDTQTFGVAGMMGTSQARTGGGASEAPF